MHIHTFFASHFYFKLNGLVWKYNSKKLVILTFFLFLFFYQFGNKVEFLWRLARAYSDMFYLTNDAEEKKNYATNGKISFCYKKNI